jgi:hypothetical protein
LADKVPRLVNALPKALALQFDKLTMVVGLRDDQTFACD